MLKSRFCFVRSWIIEACVTVEQPSWKASRMMMIEPRNRCYLVVDPGHAHGPAVSRRIDRFLQWHWLTGEVAPLQ